MIDPQERHDGTIRISSHSWEEQKTRIRELEAVEQAMGRDLVRLAERCDRLDAALSELLRAIEDDGPTGCSGVMSDGTRVWKGSFLRRIEDARAALSEN